MKRILGFGFLLMGFSFTVTQGLLVRELLVVFFGNELSIGLILGSWLVLEAIGSGLLGRLADQRRGKPVAFAALQVLFALFLPLCWVAASASRGALGAIPGEGAGPLPILSTTALILLPLALVDGAMFAFGCRAYATLTGNDVPAIGRVYVYEALGAIAGGILFTFLFIPFLYTLQIVVLLSALNLLSAALILAHRPVGAPGAEQASFLAAKWQTLAPSLLVVLILLVTGTVIVLSPSGEAIQGWVDSQRWPGFDLVYSENSAYGNVAVIQVGDQVTFYADGIPILTAPTPDVVLSEEMVHLPMLYVSPPRQALVLSGGVGGVLQELAKYPWQQLDYAELDPLLIEAVERFPTALTLGELGDSRVRVEHVDGRLAVRERLPQLAAMPQARYDLVIVNLPYPSTLQLNRFYTLEFYQMLRGVLSEQGVVVIPCPGTLTYMSAELRDLNATLYHTLKAAFPYVRPIPGDTTLWLASTSDELNTAPMPALVERWTTRSVETHLVSPSHIRLKLDQRRLDWFWASLVQEEGRAVTRINRDLHPIGLLAGLSYWSALFSPGLVQFFKWIGALSLWELSLAIGVVVLLLLAAMRLTARGKAMVVPLVIATTGLSGMAADLVIVFAFQTLYGHVFHWIGLLIGAFMAGLALGGLIMTRSLAGTTRQKSALLKIELALILYWILLAMALSTLHTHMGQPLWFSSVRWILLLLNALAGFLVGCQFPLANQLWLKSGHGHRAGLGFLYACDLVGAFLGSIVVSAALVPALGILQTCLLAAVLKLGSLLLAADLAADA